MTFCLFSVESNDFVSLTQFYPGLREFVPLFTSIESRKLHLLRTILLFEKKRTKGQKSNTTCRLVLQKAQNAVH